MRSGFSIALIVVLLFSGGYFYYIAQAVCPIPIAYRVGEVDERFNLSREEAQLAVAQAESVWEDATGENVFTYDDRAKLVVNFIFDERQAFTEAEEESKERLDATEDINEAISETYESLVAEYNELQIEYADRVAAYERRLQVHNQTVEEYNTQGGAPPEVYEQLQAERETLDQEQRELDSIATQLNSMVEQINKISERGNALIESYNEEVDRYNQTFAESREFTQGDHYGNQISIYTYKDMDELRLVLAHELGHALRLEHVENPESIMHYLIGGQPSDLSLTQEDINEFTRICGDLSIWDKIEVLFRQ